MDDEEQQRIEQDPDYVAIGHHKIRHSLTALAARYPDGAPDHVISRAFGMTPVQIGRLYANIVRKMRRWMKVDVPRSKRAK